MAKDSYELQTHNSVRSWHRGLRARGDDQLMSPGALEKRLAVCELGDQRWSLRLQISRMKTERVASRKPKMRSFL